MDGPDEEEAAVGVVEKKERGVGVLRAVVGGVGRVDAAAAAARWEEGPARPRADRRAWRFIVFGGRVAFVWRSVMGGCGVYFWDFSFWPRRDRVAGRSVDRGVVWGLTLRCVWAKWMRFEVKMLERL